MSKILLKCYATRIACYLPHCRVVLCATLSTSRVATIGFRGCCQLSASRFPRRCRSRLASGGLCWKRLWLDCMHGWRPKRRTAAMAFFSVESSFSSSNSLRAANSAHSSIVHGRDGRRENDAMECLLDRFSVNQRASYSCGNPDNSADNRCPNAVRTSVAKRAKVQHRKASSALTPNPAQSQNQTLQLLPPPTPTQPRAHPKPKPYRGR